MFITINKNHVWPQTRSLAVYKNSPGHCADQVSIIPESGYKDVSGTKMPVCTSAKQLTAVLSMVAESEVKCPTPTPTPSFQRFRLRPFQNFPLPPHNVNIVWLSTVTKKRAKYILEIRILLCRLMHDLEL